MNDRRTARAEAVSAGVDWISATLGRDEIGDQTWLYDAIHALEKIAMQGNVYKRRSMLGFDGWECAGCFVGSNDVRHYAQFAGKHAIDAYSYLEHPKVHVSRLDIQTSVKYDIELPKEGRYQYARAIHHNKTLPEARRRKIHLFAGSDGGDTIYVGSPSSEQRGRLYNKAIQSGDAAYERTWRYEVVYRNQYAARMFREVLSSDTAPTTIIIPAVTTWYRERGIDILDLGGNVGYVIETPKPDLPDVGRKLRWIKNQVVPTIRKLAEMGYAEELMEVIAEAIAAARSGQG